jgi:broad specificity phosphatase PhoE
MTLFLARHGETEWNRIGRWQGKTDIPLSETGRDQARALADRLSDRGVTDIYTSDLSRARETAEIVAAALGVTRVSSDPRLRERGFGCFEGLTREECAERHAEAWARYLADRRATPTGAEPQEQVEARVIAALTAVAESADRPGHVLVVSHGAAISSFVRSITGVAPPPIANTALFLVSVWAGWLHLDHAWIATRRCARLDRVAARIAIRSGAVLGDGLQRHFERLADRLDHRLGLGAGHPVRGHVDEPRNMIGVEDHDRRMGQLR